MRNNTPEADADRLLRGHLARPLRPFQVIAKSSGTASMMFSYHRLPKERRILVMPPLPVKQNRRCFSRVFGPSERWRPARDRATRSGTSTYIHRRVIHMIVFSRPPGRRRRAGDVRTSSSGADAPSGGREKRPSGRPCRLFGRRRADLVMDRHHGGPRS